MIACPRCGFANLDARDICLRCNAALRHSDPLKSGEPKTRRRDASGLRLRAVHLRRRLTRWMVPRLPSDLPHRRPATAAVLSALPGLGQLYNRQPLKTLWLVLAWAGSLALMVTSWFSDALAMPTLWLFVAVWIFIANDALSTAIRINGQVWTPRHAMASWFALVVLLSFVWFGSMFLIAPITYFRFIGSDAYAPLIEKGDFLWLDKWSFRFGGRPRRGELVYYDPRGFSMWRGQNLLFYDTESFIERVIGLPGETVAFERVGGEIEITVDGVALPRELYPLSTEWLPERRSWKVPENTYLILQSMTLDEGFVDAAGVAPSLSGLDLDVQKAWTESCLVEADCLTGRVWLISAPPSRRRWFSRVSESEEWMPR
jgi:signal peptidase I